MPPFRTGFQSHLLHTHKDGAKPLDFGVSDLEHHNSSYWPRSYFDGLRSNGDYASKGDFKLTTLKAHILQIPSIDLFYTSICTW